VRVALIAPLVSPIRDAQLGGAQAVVADIARELGRRGHDVVVYAARGSAIEGVAIAPLDIDPASLHGDLFRDETEQTPSEHMTAAYAAVYGHVLAARFDVVHSHGFDVPAITVAAAMGLPVLHTLHMPASRPVAVAITDARRRPTAVWTAAVSHAQAATWRLLVAIDAVLSNGVPVEDIPFDPVGGGTAVIAARFSPEKGIDDGIAAARLADLPVDVYGTPYDAGHERAVRERWRDDQEVRFLAPAAREDLWSALGAAGAVVCLSRWEEPFGMVAAEAAASGTPVVASRRGALAEVVLDGVTGYVVTAGDVIAAAAALRRVNELSRGDCRRHAVDALNLGATVTAHEALYAQIASAGRSPSP
jgi:UDP-glucose:tetrahydrobiopterin glucosyltransferase